MYDAKVVPTFECVELALEKLMNIDVSGLARDAKAVKRIIGDMAHTYYFTFPDEFDVNEMIENVLAVMRKEFPDLHFSTRQSKNSKGVNLRVGATPPTDVPLAQQAIDEILNATKA